MGANWKDVCFGEIFDISSSKRVLQKQWKTSGVPFYRAREIVKLAANGHVENDLFISDELYNEFSSKYGVPQPGDLMISAVGTLGACYAVKEGDRFYFKDASVLRFSPRQDVDTRYIQHAFRTDSVLRQIHAGSGSTVGTYTISRAKKTKILLPPLEEQKRIAKILDAADALRAKRRESLAQLDALLQSTFLDLFGDPVKNEKRWDKINIGNIARSKPNNGVFRKNNEYSERGGHGVPVIWLEELFKGSYLDVKNARRLALDSKELDKYGLFYGDVLFCRSSLKLDGIAYNNVYLGEDRAAAFECHLIRVSPDLSKCNPIFFSAQLRTPPLRACLKSVSKTSTMTTIDQKAICGVDVIVPPMELQDKFANLAKAVDLEKEKIRKVIFELDTLFLSLQQRAFSGEL